MTLTENHPISLGTFTVRRYRLHSHAGGTVNAWGNATLHVNKDHAAQRLNVALVYDHSRTIDQWAARHMGATLQITCWSDAHHDPNATRQWGVLGTLIRVTHVSTRHLHGSAPINNAWPGPLRLSWHTAPGSPVAVTDYASAPSVATRKVKS